MKNILGIFCVITISLISCKEEEHITPDELVLEYSLNKSELFIGEELSLDLNLGQVDNWYYKTKQYRYEISIDFGDKSVYLNNHLDQKEIYSINKLILGEPEGSVSHYYLQRGDFRIKIELKVMLGSEEKPIAKKNFEIPVTVNSFGTNVFFSVGADPLAYKNTEVVDTGNEYFAISSATFDGSIGHWMTTSHHEIPVRVAYHAKMDMNLNLWVNKFLKHSDGYFLPYSRMMKFAHNGSLYWLPGPNNIYIAFQYEIATNTVHRFGLYHNNEIGGDLGFIHNKIVRTFGSLVFLITQDDEVTEFHFDTNKSRKLSSVDGASEVEIILSNELDGNLQITRLTQDFSEVLSKTINLSAPIDSVVEMQKFYSSEYVILCDSQEDTIIAKIDKNGNLIWEKKFNLPNPVGLSQSNFDLVIVSKSGQMVKLSGTGDLVWEKELPLDLEKIKLEITDCSEVENGGVLLGGTITIPEYSYNLGNPISYLIKLNADGEIK